jgi:hypothetical protein
LVTLPSPQAASESTNPMPHAQQMNFMAILVADPAKPVLLFWANRLLKLT